MKDLGYGKGYRYPHAHEGAHVDEEYLPESLKGSRFYQPTDRGFERRIGEILDRLRGRDSRDQEPG